MDNYTNVELLLIEDTATDAELMLHSLKKNNFPGKVHWVKDGHEALDFLFCEGTYGDRDKHDLPRVILLDINIPKVNGIEVLELIKFDEYLRTIPVVVMTSSSEQKDMVESYKQGANGYVVKPVAFEEFEEVVRQISTYWTTINRAPKKL